MKPDADKFVAALEEFFLRYNFGKITLPQDDIALIAQFISYIPPHFAFLRDDFAAGFARALDLLRRQKELRWLN